MSDEEIIKGLEYCCSKEDTGCRDCPCFESGEGCVTEADALDVIKHQKEEIEMLEYRLKCHRAYIQDLQDQLLLTELTKGDEGK